MSDQSSQKPDQNGPLHGIRVLVTRPVTTPDSLVSGLEKLGAETVRHPMIEYASAPDPARLEDISARLDQFCMLAYLSRQAASAFDEQASPDKESMPPIGAIGNGTRECLQQSGYEVEFLPGESNSESMAEILIERFRSLGYSKPILILRANRGSDVLPNALTAAKIPFEELAVYQSLDVTAADPTVLRDLAEGKFQWLTITSSSIACNVARLFSDHVGTTKIASISPTTSQAAAKARLSVTVEATEYNVDGLIDAIVRHEAT